MTSRGARPRAVKGELGVARNWHRIRAHNRWWTEIHWAQSLVEWSGDQERTGLLRGVLGGVDPDDLDPMCLERRIAIAFGSIEGNDDYPGFGCGDRHILEWPDAYEDEAAQRIEEEFGA